MKVCKFLLSSTIVAFCINVYADEPTYDDSWQYNRNVTIEKMYVYWDTGSTRIQLSNNEICHIVREDKELYAVALAMRAQKVSGQAICQRANDSTFNGTADRRLHRLTY